MKNSVFSLCLFLFLLAVSQGCGGTRVPIQTEPEDEVNPVTFGSLQDLGDAEIIEPLSDSDTAQEYSGGASTEDFSRFYHRFPAHDSLVTGLVVLPDGVSAISADVDGNIIYSEIVNAKTKERWNLVSSEGLALRKKVLLQSGKPATSLSLSADGRYLAIAWFSYVAIVDLASGELVAELTKVVGRISALSWDPRGELLGIGMANGDVFIWHVRPSERWLKILPISSSSNTAEALETYFSGTSPVVSVVFHPSGRSFISSEQEGRLLIWRLLRTEREDGLRDTFTKDDEKRIAQVNRQIADLGIRLYDTWFERESEIIFSAAADGKVYRWKMRGLKPLGPRKVVAEAVYATRALTLPDQGLPESTRIMVASSREHKIVFWCAESEASAIAKLLRVPLALIDSARDSRILWGAEKSGNLLTFDLARLAEDPEISSVLQDCGFPAKKKLPLVEQSAESDNI